MNDNRPTLSRLAAAAACSAILWSTAAVGQQAQRARRAVMPKTLANALPVAAEQTRVVVKLAEGRPELVRRGAIDAAEILAVIDGRSTRSFFAGLEDELASIRARQLAAAPEGTRPAVDLSLYYEVHANSAADARRLVQQLNALPSVELAYPRELPTPPPGDDPPFTPDFSNQQGYRAPAPDGIDANAVQALTGASGAGITVLDIEWGWDFGHEDIAPLTAASLIGPPIFNSTYNNHGVAACGEIAADVDGHGVSGLNPDITLRVATDYPASGYSVANAIAAGLPALGSGDVMLLEAQTSTPLGLGPTEWNQADFDAILIATNLGILTVEAAGNGGVNLDSPVLNGLFDLSVRDSGAIIVGASDGVSLARAGFSSYGSRVTANGWGRDVATTGYGSLFSAPGTSLQDYTASFNGTSSASPIVTAAVVAVRGAADAQLDPTAAAALDAFALRSLIEATGTPIPNIGSRPDAAALLAAADILRGLTVSADPRLGTNVVLEIERSFAGTTGDLYGLFGATSTMNAPLPAPFVADSRRLLDPATTAPASFGTFNGATADYTISVPNNAALVGQSFYFQAITLDQNNGSLAATNSARVYVRK
ncbi:MAG: S8 family serine peptidase [Planctomycetota bacterium]